jgi:hypothetical protein
MYATVRTPVVTCALALTVCLGYLAATPHARAQLAPVDGVKKTPEPGLEIDTAALLTEARVLETSVESNIWSIKPQPGRRLIQIPMTVTATDQTSRLASPSVKLRGGRFIAWRIVPDERDASSAQNIRTGQRNAPGFNAPSIGNLRNLDLSDLDQLDKPTQSAPRQADDAVELAAELPKDIPVLARDVTISPQGVIHWQLERAIPGAEVKTGDAGYLLKLRPDRLQKLEPQRPARQGRATGGQNSREAAAKRRTEELEYRNKAEAYRALRNQVRKLPDKFQAKLPARLWAIYEVSDRFNELSFTGAPPMPWRVALNDLDALRQVASRSGRSGELTREDFTAVSQMNLMLADEHPLTQRLVADTLGAADMYGRAQTGDALYRLIDALLKGSDARAKRTVTAGLASTVPPTPTTLALLKGAFTHLDPGSKLLALSGILATQDNDPISRRQMIETANQMIADPDGPGVVYVLDELSRALEDKPDAVSLVGGGIRFDTLDPASLDQAIVFTADAAGRSAVAAAWMEHGLLGSSSPRIVRRTVEILGTSAPGGGAVSKLTKAMIRFAFGPANADAASRAKPPLRGIASIPIGSTGHSIYRVLNAGDPELRTLGWKALRHFQVLEDPAAQRGPTPTKDNGDEPDRLELILNAAFNETVTPPQLVTFLVNQQDPQAATAALVRIVVEGRGPAITQAARALVRSGRDLDQPIQALNPDQRGAFAGRLYEAVTGAAPMVAGLMRVPDARSPLVNWFSRHISSTGLPQASDWAQAANGEDNLVTLAASSDPELAEAAVAGLVASAGGDEQTARDLARRLANATDRSVDGIREQWDSAKQDIYTSRMRHAAGRYRLVVNLRGSANTTFRPDPRFGNFDLPTLSKGPTEAANAPLIKSYNVALIELQADGRSLALASGTLTLGVSDTGLAIALEDPSELKDFGHSELSKLPLEDIDGPIDLLPKKDGSWRGAAPLRDGRGIEVVFDPE